MEKSRIVAVLRQARRLRKDKTAKTVISARLAARKPSTNSAKPQNASRQMKEGARLASPGEASPIEATPSEAAASRHEARPPDATLDSPE